MPGSAIDCRLPTIPRRGGPMKKEYISTIVLDPDSAEKQWHEEPDGLEDESASSDDQGDTETQEFSGVHTWVS